MSQRRTPVRSGAAEAAGHAQIAVGVREAVATGRITNGHPQPDGLGQLTLGKDPQLGSPSGPTVPSDVIDEVLTPRHGDTVAQALQTVPKLSTGAATRPMATAGVPHDAVGFKSPQPRAVGSGVGRGGTSGAASSCSERGIAASSGPSCAANVHSFCSTKDTGMVAMI